MASLLIVIFVVELAVAVVNSIGAATINNLLWKLYIATPLGTSKQIRDQRELQSRYLKVRQDLASTSSQDEFAKWAKLRRQHDKMLEELEKMSPFPPCRKPQNIPPCLTKTPDPVVFLYDVPPPTENGIEGSKAAFDKTVNSARWLGTSGMRYFLPFWYSKTPMFWLPHGWFPYHAEWIISFPRAPIGSVSVASWQLACTGVITLVADTITAVISLVVAAMQGSKGKHAENPINASSATTDPTSSQGEKDGSKKEL
ncbi:CHD5 domain-containing protein [Diaporthe helianthi]|uniref:CHD5 domain-containing protein n=1 Tax=Diaporthe helianthi TaxID=158607 RepID=A0A2P5I862_DIAHE|nr:CHD5 domain-containing protein [Diaporthe helianthi]